MLSIKLKKIAATSLTYCLVASITVSSAMGFIFMDGHRYLGLDSELKTPVKNLRTGSKIGQSGQTPKKVVTIADKKESTPTNTNYVAQVVKNNGNNNSNPVSNNKTSPRYSAPIPENDLPLLARIIHAEAGGESIKGQVAVGAVLINRINSGRFPKTLAANIFRPGEFESVSNGYIWSEPTAASYQAARLAVNGWDPTYGALYFFNPEKSSSRWIWSRPVTIVIGQHNFAG